MAAGWINSANTSTVTTSSIMNNWVNVISTPTTGATGYVTQYFNTGNYSPKLSSEEMIRHLEARDYVVLKKRICAPPPRVFDYLRYSDQDIVDSTINTFYAYVLPEKAGKYVMPDGSTLDVDAFGNYQVSDQDAKVTYKANRIREFNPYINASDLLEKFIKEVGILDGVRQDEILQLPIEAFINWIILQAAKKDGDSLEGLPKVEAALPPPIPKLPRCRNCGRFLSKAWAAMRISFCSQEHMKRFQSRALVPV